MSVTSQELNGLISYSLTSVRTLAGLDRVRDVIVAETQVEPIDGSVILAEKNGSPHAEIVFQQYIAPELIAFAEISGAMMTSRTAEMNLR